MPRCLWTSAYLCVLVWCHARDLEPLEEMKGYPSAVNTISDCISDACIRIGRWGALPSAGVFIYCCFILDTILESLLPGSLRYFVCLYSPVPFLTPLGLRVGI